MALEVEDGTGKANAESYISVADADTRQSSLGMTTWASLTTDEKEQALRRATIYMEGAYSSLWKGTRSSSAQALSWPRSGAMVHGYALSGGVVPENVKGACADLALKAAAGELAADLTRAVKREKLGPLETEYADNSPQSKRYPSIDMILSAYLKGSSAMVRLARS